tara:strand:- start:245 stop:457 length:213 start_codon:yes stop_codon:yes gene_type:complete
LEKEEEEMNKIIIVIQNLAVKLVLSNKDKIIAEMNKQFNIPFASESDEQELLEGLWELLEDSMTKAIKSE